MAGYEDGQGKGGKKMDGDNVNPAGGGLGNRAGTKKPGNNPTTTHWIRVKSNEIEHETTSKKTDNTAIAY